MTDYKYKYGHGYKEFSLPEEHVLGELKMKQMPPLENLKAAVLDALYHPIASAPINELVQPGMKLPLSVTIQLVLPTRIPLCPFWLTK